MKIKKIILLLTFIIPIIASASYEEEMDEFINEKFDFDNGLVIKSVVPRNTNERAMIVGILFDNCTFKENQINYQVDCSESNLCNIHAFKLGPKKFSEECYNDWKEYADEYGLSDEYIIETCTNSETVYEKDYSIGISYDEPEEKIEYFQEIVDNLTEKYKSDNFPNNYAKYNDLILINNKIVHQFEYDSSVFNWIPEIKGILNNTNAKLIYSDTICRGGFGDAEPSVFNNRNIEGHDEALIYNEYIYGVGTVSVGEIDELFIPQNTPENEEQYVKAAQKRIDEYFGKDNGIVVSYGGTLQEYHEMIYPIIFKHYMPVPTLSEFENSDSTKKLEEGSDGNYYILTYNGKEYYFMIKKGTEEQVAIPEYKGIDLSTDIEIKTVEPIPFDAYVVSREISDEGINKVMGVGQFKDYDISLYSDSVQGEIKTLKNGHFEVKVPIPEGMNPNKIIIYYYDRTNNKLSDPIVPSKIENGYAIFKTNHFSEYVITDKEVIRNPQTGDNLIYQIIMTIISLILISIIMKKYIYNTF